MKTELEIKETSQIVDLRHKLPISKRWVSLESHNAALKEELLEESRKSFDAGKIAAIKDCVARDAKILKDVFALLAEERKKAERIRKNGEVQCKTCGRYDHLKGRDYFNNGKIELIDFLEEHFKLLLEGS